MNKHDYPVHAPGWAALDRVGQTLYSGQTPHQFASKTGYDLNSPSPLPAVCVWEASDPAHWHYVTYGLTELFEKSSPDPSLSGFGFELTLRTPRASEASLPPSWPVSLLQGIGRYALSGQGGLDTGHLIDLGAPLAPRPDAPTPTQLTGVVAIPDATFGKVDTQFGSVLFLQLYGLTDSELKAMRTWTMDRKVGLVRDVDALGLTVLEREPLAESRATAAAFRRYELGVMI